MTKIIDFFQKHEILKKSYVWFLITIFYIPIIVGAIFAFNAPSKKVLFLQLEINLHCKLLMNLEKKVLHLRLLTH